MREKSEKCKKTLKIKMTFLPWKTHIEKTEKTEEKNKKKKKKRETSNVTTDSTE